MPELANEDDLDDEPENAPPKNATDTAIVQRICDQIKAIRATVRTFDEMGLLEDLPPLDEPIEKLDVHNGVNRAFTSFCAEIDRVYEKLT
jgi:hypothetical protein